MCSSSLELLCPLCAQTTFSNIDALRSCLIKIANGPLSCPICQEQFLGLDKLTIHLFTHNTITTISGLTTITETPSVNNQNNANYHNSHYDHHPVELISTTMNKNDEPVLINCKQNDIYEKHHQIDLPTTLPNVMRDGVGNFENTHHANIVNKCVQNESINNNKTDGHDIRIEIENRDFITQQQQQQQQQQQDLQHQGILQQKSEEKREQLDQASKLYQQHIYVNSIVTTTTTAITTTSTMNDINRNNCNICKSNFPNKHIKDMHQILIHDQNISDIFPAASKVTSTRRQQISNVNDLEDNLISLNTSSSCTSSTSTTTLPVSSFVHSNSPSKQIIMHNYEYKCHLCMKSFRLKGSLRVHLKVVHSIGLIDNNNNSKTNYSNLNENLLNEELKLSANSVPNGGNFSTIENHEQLEQTIENYSNQNVANLEQDLIKFKQFNHIDNNNSNNNNNNNKNNMNAIKLNVDVIENFNPKIWECDVCSKCFTTKYFLKKHKRLHTGEMPYTCELCARTFTFQQSYHKHLLYHSNEKPHVCQTCGRAFKELSTLHNHERIHSGEKPFKCELCGKCFRQRVSFLVHTRIHTGVMPYKCELCEKSFRYKVSQRTHKCQVIKTNHNDNNYHNNISSGRSNDTQQNKGRDVEKESILEEITMKTLKSIIKASTQNDTKQSDVNSVTQQQHQEEQPALLVDNSEKCIELNNILPFVDDGAATISIQRNSNLNLNSMENNVNQLYENRNAKFVSTNSNNVDLEIYDHDTFSPIAQLQNMRLYSPQLLLYDDNDLTRFLLDHSDEFVNTI